MSISENVVEKEVLAYIKEKKSSNVGLRNLFPPVKICCGTALNFRLSSKCIVFEKNSGGVPGLIYTGSCKKCKTIYSTTVQVGCKKTPIKGYYCVDHQFSTISTEQVRIIKIVIIFLVGKIGLLQQTVYTYSFFQSYLVTYTENEIQLQCKTEKRKQACS